MRYAKVRRCGNGRIRYYTEERHLRLWMWRLYRCPECRVIVLPYMIRWADWRWWKWWLLHAVELKINDWKYNRND
jgi:hypothetical protein